jgi:zinc transport system substrate-binding protein
MDPRAELWLRWAAVLTSRKVLRVVAFLALLVLGSVAMGCRKKPAPRIKVAVTVFPIYDLTRRIAGPDADVVLLIPPGRSEMDFEPTDREAAAVAGAKLGILVGLGLDEWMQALLDQVAPSARRLSVGDRVPTLLYHANAIETLLAHQGMPDVQTRLDGKPDPHVWLDPARAELIAKAIAEEMAKADPSRAAGYRQRASELETDLENLDREIEWRVENWKSQFFISFRPAFAYYASHYRLIVATTLEAYPGTIPPTRYDQEVVKLIRSKGIAGVFREPQFNPKPASVVGTAAHVPVGVMDAVGGQGETDTYDKLIRFNTDALEKVLKAPAEPPPPDAGSTADGGSQD